MNFETAYLLALDALIVALGGVVPVASVRNFQAAHLLRLAAVVNATGGVLPSPSLNYEAAVLAHWRAAIAARGGTIPTVYRNHRQGLVLHVQAFQATRGISVALSAPNFEANILALLSAVPPYDADFVTWANAVEATGANFGPTAEAIAANKLLINNQIFAGLKADGVPLTSFNYAALRVGPSSLAGAQVSIRGNPTFNGLVSGDYARLTGIKYGTSKSIQSNLPQNSLGQNNQAITAYYTENSAGDTSGAHWGVIDAGGGGRNTSVNAATRGVTNTNDTRTSTGELGLYAVSRLNSSEYIRRAGSAVETVASASVNQLQTAGISFNVFTGATNFGTQRTAWESIGLGLTTAQLGAIATRVSAVLAGLT